MFQIAAWFGRAARGGAWRRDRKRNRYRGDRQRRGWREYVEYREKELLVRILQLCSLFFGIRAVPFLRDNKSLEPNLAFHVNHDSASVDAEIPATQVAILAPSNY